MTILDYHRLRQAEEKSRDLAQIEAAVRAQDGSFPERAQRLLPELPEHWLRDAVLRRQQTHQLAPLDPNLHELCQIYLAATPEQRIFIRSRIDRPHAIKLMGFAGAAAILGIRQKSEALVRLGLVAHAIDGLNSGDARDSLIAVTLLFHAAKAIGSDPAALFQEAAAMAGPGMAALLLDFLQRPPEIQTLASMGWREVQRPEGVDFEPAGWGHWKPPQKRDASQD